jgi:PKD repeat protein
LDQNGVYEFSSTFGPKNCSSNCPNTLKISIKDYRPSTAKPTVIDSSIAVGSYLFAAPSGIPSQFSQTFIGGLLNKTGILFTWDFGDQTPVIPTSTYSITHTYVQPGIYNVTLTVKDSSLCTSVITNAINLGQTNNPLTATYYPVNYPVNTVGDSVLFTAAPTGGTGPYSYSWNFGDGNSSTIAGPIHEYASAGTYLTSLSLTDAAGNTNIQYANINVPSTYGCASFFHLSTLSTVLDPLDLKGIIIEWTDPSGKLWTSNNDLQTSANSSFKIVSVENYLNNENGDPTKKIQVELSCKLYNGTNSIELKNAKSTIAVAYKK